MAGHRTLLFGIVSNLLDNAIRYNRAGGLAAADLARAGQRFVRLASRAGREGGGLGLAIVRSAAQRLGAELAIINTDPGLRVTLAFPQAQGPPPVENNDPPQR